MIGEAPAKQVGPWSQAEWDRVEAQKTLDHLVSFLERRIATRLAQAETFFRDALSSFPLRLDESNVIGLADNNQLDVTPKVRSGRFPICATLETTCYELDLDISLARNGARFLRFVLPVSVYPEGFSRRVEAKREHIMEALSQDDECTALTPLARYIRMVLYRLIMNFERGS